MKYALYGERSASRSWARALDKVLRRFGARPLVVDRCCYQMDINGEKVWLGVFVDDTILFGTSKSAVDLFIRLMRDEFGEKETKETNIF